MSDVERKAAAMTPQQRETIKRIYKRFVTTCVVFAVVLLLIFGSISAYCTYRVRKWVDATPTTISSSETLSEYRARSDQWQAEGETVHQLQLITKFGWIVTSVIGIGGLAVILLVYKKKYPYYSEKLYRAVRRIEKQQGY